jgi:hypothetical protein
MILILISDINEIILALTHWYCKGHGGAFFMMGKGAMLSYSSKVKANTRSLMEMELVTANMFMPEML